GWLGGADPAARRRHGLRAARGARGLCAGGGRGVHAHARGSRELLMSEVATRLHLNGGDLTVQRAQGGEDILSRNKARQAEPQRSDWGRHVATIPVIFLERWLNEEHARGNIGLRLFTPEFDTLIKRKLRDPEWRFLRTDK